MVWDLITGLSLVVGFGLIIATWKEIGRMKQEISDLTTMVRIFRYRALEEERDKLARQKEK
jgi:hypothetical protein